MKSIQSIILPVFLKTLLLLVVCFVAVPIAAQSDKETLLGTALTLDVQKDLARNLSGALEEEVRLVNNSIGFDRTVTTLGLDYSLLEQKLKVGASYAFIRLYNSDNLFESRHRYYLNVSYKETIEPFTFSWRGRLQATSRDETRDSYKINPKYVMKNKLEVAYTVFGSPWKPYISCDFSTMLNDPAIEGFELTRIRFVGGTTWRMNRTTYLDFFLRYDREMDWRDPNVLSLGICYKVKLL